MRRDESLVRSYLDKLKRDATRLFRQFPNSLDTIYFGGGTPSHLSDAELAEIVLHLQNLWGQARLESTLRG